MGRSGKNGKGRAASALLRFRGGLGTIGALAVQDHAGAFDPLGAGGRRGRRERVEVLPAEIDHLAAAVAEKVMMRAGEGLVAGLRAGGFQAVDQAEPFEGGQGAVDRVQGEGGQPSGEAGVQGLGGRVVLGLEQLPVDFQALLGDLEARGLADLFEPRNAVWEGRLSMGRGN